MNLNIRIIDVYCIEQRLSPLFGGKKPRSSSMAFSEPGPEPTLKCMGDSETSIKRIKHKLYHCRWT